MYVRVSWVLYIFKIFVTFVFVSSHQEGVRDLTRKINPLRQRLKVWRKSLRVIRKWWKLCRVMNTWEWRFDHLEDRKNSWITDRKNALHFWSQVVNYSGRRTVQPAKFYGDKKKLCHHTCSYFSIGQYHRGRNKLQRPVIWQPTRRRINFSSRIAFFRPASR